MCEWLSYGEWCDVKLLCGGRAFSAHRAVLASVSTFLRRILLSCPTDETPTFIVLPEFDLDAMSAVLYYIYNGEVIVQKQKLEMFLDIIKAMQIFIDNQYLPQNIDSEYSHSNLNHHETDLSKRNIFTLGLEDSRDQRFINLKKGSEIQDMLLQYSVNNADCNDKLVRSQNPSGERKSSLGNLKSPYGDRQRNSFLRDLFIETYPPNGNVNGLTTGVLAISNECYHAPASALSTNANGKHLSADDALLESYKKSREYISNSPTVFHLRKQQRCTHSEQDYGETSKSFYNTSVVNFSSAQKINKKCDTKIGRKNNWMNHVSASSFFQIGIQEQILSGLYVPSVDYSFTPSMAGSFKSMHSYSNKTSAHSSPTLCSDGHEERSKEMDSNLTSKVTILNHVLDSPWSPRIPNNYKPFRRKIENSMESQLLNHKGIEKIVVNDTNNNVERSSMSVNELHVGEEVSAVKPNETTASTLLVRGEIDLKCTICNQVFTNSELLSIHMRRHSTNARYTCGECGKTFSQLRNFKYHMSIHRGTREFAATCSVCGKYFNDRGYLSSHMKIHRNRKEYKCTLCPKSFNQRVAYNMHVRIHTGVKPHVCEQCGKAFSRKMLLKQHQRTHSGERPYACPHCDKRFADRSNMTLHLRLHTGIKPFSCTLCPKSFTKKHHLKSHLNFHTGSKPYSCPRCKLAFTQSSNMRTHLKKCRAPEPMPENETPQNM